MYRLLRALLFLLPAETAHHLGIWTLSVLGTFVALCRRMRARTLEKLAASSGGVSLRTRVAGLELEHPLMLAAGLDKDARAVQGLFGLGFSAVEIGTVTPRPQPGNPLPRLFRLPEHEALINRMGFNNQGALSAANRLRALAWRPGPVGGNIGKNKATPIEHATDDYLLCVDEVAPVADYVVVNASSPNTPGLRSLQDPEALEALLVAVRARMDTVAKGKPLFLKIAPDLGLEAVDAIVEVAVRCRIDGLIATNTTITRPVEHPIARETGGFSGRPMADQATRVVARAFQRAKGRLPIIGVGGICDAQEAWRKIRAGASAVQLYTGFIYGGPGTVRRMLPELAALVRQDGFASIEAAVGVDAASIAGERAPAPAQ